jgi:uncharacterized membrane protein
MNCECELRIRRLLLLLFLLLHHVLAVGILKRLENVGVEQRGADVVQLELRLVEIIVQAAVKNFVNGAELQFGEEAAGQLFGVVAKIPSATPEIRRRRGSVRPRKSGPSAENPR